MKITYIHHSSFCVELSHITLLFDYYKGELPVLSKEKPLVVFASHFHKDHYSPVIFELFKSWPEVHYVLSEEIREYSVPEKLQSQIRYVRAGESFTFNPGELMTVETFCSTDEGVAFWIQCEGKQIYHAGDLNNWWWEGEDKGWLDTMAAIYDRELLKMEGRHADAAFVPLDPRLGRWFYLGLDQFMKKVDAARVFPMHLWRDYTIIEKLKKLPESEGYRDRIVEIHREGEEFTE